MTSTTAADGSATVLAPSPTTLLKTDRLGRVRSTREHREAVLAEFDRSGLSAAQFAQLIGMKYTTLASWCQQRRRERSARPPGGGPLRLVEAVVDCGSQTPTRSDESLRLQLPGGGQVELASPQQMPLVVSLLQALARGC
jgi:transposase-like protein